MDDDDDSSMQEMMGFSSFGGHKRKKLNSGAVSSIPSSKFLRSSATWAVYACIALDNVWHRSNAKCDLLHTHCNLDGIVHAYPKCERRLPAVTLLSAHEDVAMFSDCRNSSPSLSRDIHEQYPGPFSSSAARLPQTTLPNLPLH